MIRLALALAVLLANAAAVFAQSAENVAVVINENSPASIEIGEYYARKRALPRTNVIRIRTAVEDNIDRGQYVATIETPIAAALSKESLQDRVTYLVLTKGVPIRVLGNVGPAGTVSSVDSELVLLYRKMSGRPVAVEGRVENPYYLGTRPVTEVRRFTHRDHDIYLVTRLDAFTVKEALALVDRSLAASPAGRIVLDQQDKLVNREGEDWLKEASDRLVAAGHADRVLLETTVQGVRDVSPVLGYYSWGSNDPNNRVRKFGLGFAPGSIAAMFVSTDGRTFKEPQADWVPTGDGDKSKWYGGTPQSLTGDLIREGATGAAGHVAEPFLSSAIRPQILFPMYLSGNNLAESFYAAMPHLSWQTVVIGDPLCAPFAKGSLNRADLEDPVDGETMLPGLFSRRRTPNLKQVFAGASDKAIALALRGETLVNRGDLAGARLALEQSTALAPKVVPIQMQLALLYDRTGDHAAAEARYRQVVALDPKQFLALNNLAFTVAVRNKKPAEGLPLAKQAVALAPQHPLLLDTLAWIEHLLGDHALAATHIAAAIKGAPGLPQLRVRGAEIYLAAGDHKSAQLEMQAALKINPALEATDDVKALRAKLGLAGSTPQ